MSSSRQQESLLRQGNCRKNEPCRSIDIWHIDIDAEVVTQRYPYMQTKHEKEGDNKYNQKPPSW